MRVLVFGDSIAYGAWDSEGGWVDRLKRLAHQQTIESEGTQKLQVINLGIGGDSSTKIRARMEAEITARISASWPFIFIFSFNANDERSYNNQPETSLADFKINNDAIIKIAKKYTNKILFVGCTPMGMPEVTLKGAVYSDERIIQYEQVQKQLVTSQKIQFVDVREAFESAQENVFCYDKLHPNNAGHALIAELVAPKLWELTK